MNDAAMLGNSGYARVSGDAYFTPAWCVEELLRDFKPRGVVWEPACGDGAIVRVLEARDLPYVASDLNDHGCGYDRADFFSESPLIFNAIITNPPYELAEKFVRRALDLTRKGGKVAMLLRNEWDCAKSRMDLFGHPFAKKLVLTKRPRWFAEKRASPRHNFSWFIWDWLHSGPPTLAYGPPHPAPGPQKGGDA